MPVIDNYYNIVNFPFFVCHHGNWDIYANARGYCASIPVVDGCNASHFGEAAYVKVTLGVDVLQILKEVTGQ